MKHQQETQNQPDSYTHKIIYVTIKVMLTNAHMYAKSITNYTHPIIKYLPHDPFQYIHTIIFPKELSLTSFKITVTLNILKYYLQGFL